MLAMMYALINVNAFIAEKSPPFLVNFAVNRALSAALFLPEVFHVQLDICNAPFASRLSIAGRTAVELQVHHT